LPPGAPNPAPAWNWWKPKGNELISQWRTTPQMIDWNGDGLMDLVMSDPAGYLALYERKRNVFVEAVQGSRFTLVPASGTYFQLLGYSGISEEGDIDFAMRLTKEFKITGIPCSVFYPNQHDDCVLRFCFAKEDEQLLKAAEILRSI
jgi:aspartate/methionine/tyrosine aminotransferase